MGLGIVVVEVCTQNALAALPLEELEEEHIEVDVLRTDCLSMCQLCLAKPYAMVNNKRIVAKTSEQCLAKIKEAVEQQIKDFYEG
ncbi:hypothetical protein J31TS4_26600 [Paenibacillus sp. J31TS4]|uniref:DUF1450 domain-containing protein n=1 Tax=Paenibacillus sp. J31TS4 TaxID=2807195 RepID=UPI001B25C163|nr:DUF1450 domain-containing protein [Paenibacillus sp. J31TS4]GIP39380.1 hypothetical protein J31TS4_26600 [Paenibacillus sp. J31TS4]